MQAKRRDPLAIVLFIAALLLLGCSLLTVLSAPTAVLWIISIVITEWGHYAAIIALIVAALACKRSRLSALVALIAAAFCISPAVRASRMSRTLPTRCTDAFGLTSDRRAPFTFAGLFRLVPQDDVERREFTYAVEENKPLKLDLYQQRNATAPQPVVITIHGGSWKGGKKSMLTGENFHLATEGYAVAAIEYRHAPQWKFPAAVDDVFRAIEFLTAQSNESHLDPTRIVLLGRSAGGQLALSAAYSGRAPNIRGVVSFYGPTDLVLGYQQPSRRLVLDSRKVLEDYLGGAPNEQSEVYAAASPINFVGAATPPTLLIHGLLDPIVWPNQSELLAAKLRAAGRPHLLLELPWATHGCDANPTGPSGQLSAYAIDRFLAAILR